MAVFRRIPEYNIERQFFPAASAIYRRQSNTHSCVSVHCNDNVCIGGDALKKLTNLFSLKGLFFSVGLHSEIRELFPYTLSFFCAGLPSKDAQRKLLQEMGCTQKITELRYRGNGWSGMTTAIEADGRNAVFCRSIVGESLLNEMVKSGNNIEVKRFVDFEDKLKYMQAYQYDRRATMSVKILALKIMKKSTPRYNNVIKKLGVDTSFFHKLHVFKGTVTRILNGKI